MAQNVYTQKWEAAVAEVKNSKSSGQSSGSKNTYQSAWESAISELLNYGSDGYKSLSQQRKEQEMQRRNRTTPGKEIIDQFLSDANLFYGDAERAIENSTWTDAVNSFASRKEQADALKKSALAVSETLNANMDYYDPGYYDSMMEYLSNFDSNVDNTLLSLEDYFGQWDSEESYQKHLNYLANEEAKRTLDVSAAEKELAEMQAARDDYAHNHEFDWTSAVERNAYDLYLQDLDKQISDKRQFTNQAKRLQEGIDLASVTGNEDFADKSGYVSTYADNPLDSLLSQFNMGYNDLTYEYINNQNGIRDEISRLAKGHGYTRNTTEGNYEYMTPEEVAIYNYHYATGGKEKAQQYLDNIQESLNYRKANELVEDLSGKTTQQYKFAATAGLDQFKQGIRNFLNTDDDYLNYSAYQIASQKVREDLADNGIKLPDALGGASLGQVAYDIINTGANMAPAMLAGLATGMINPTLGKLTGSALMGMNAGGGALQEALNEGYAREQARKYAVESGIAEAGMEYLLGGIGAFSNGIVGVDDAIKAVSNPVGRFALNLGKGMGSEAFEEGLQEYISPKIKNKNLYTEEKASASDIAYASILGGLTGGVMDLPGSVSSSFSRRTPSGSSSSSSADVSSDSAPKIKAKVSEDGNAKKISTNENVVVLDFASVDHNNATIQLKDGETVPYSDVSFASEAEANRFYTVASLPGIETEAANNLLHTIEEANVGGDIDSVTGIREAYGMGYYGMQESDLAKGSDSSRLAPDLRKAVFDIGRQQRNADALAKPTATAVTAKPAEGYKKVVFEGNVSRTVKKNAAEIRFVDYIADNFSGNTVHIYESFRGRDGKYYYRDSKGELHRAPNGRYVNGEIWLDTKAGDNGEGLMLNTFAHEMYHHIEKYNKAKAQELAEFVVKELGFESVEKSVAEQIKKARKAGLGESYFERKGMSKEQAANEVYTRAMSDFVADSLETMFTRGDPAKSIANLKQENRTLFDEIKAFIDKWVSKLKKYYSDKTISKEGEVVAQLENFEKLQQLFMEAMQGAGENYRVAEIVDEKNITMDGDVKYQARDSDSLTNQEITAIQSIGRKSINSFTSQDLQTVKKFAERYWKEMGVKSPFFRAWFGDWRVNDQNLIQIATQKDDTRGIQKNNDTGWDIQVSGKVFAESKHFAKKNTEAIVYLPYINDIVRNAILLDSTGVEHGKAKSDNTLLMHSFYAVADIGNGKEVLKLYVEEMNDPNKKDTAKRAYQLQNIEKAFTVNGGVRGKAPSSLANTANAIKTVADLFKAVKQYDKNFAPNNVSKVTNNDGTPKIMYHGTSNSGFSIFDTYFSRFGLFGRGFYFTDNEEIAESYTQKGKGKNPGVYDVYLSIQNPIDMDAKANINAWKQAFDQMDLDVSYLYDVNTNEDAFRALKSVLQDEGYVKWEAEDIVSSILESMGHDGVTHVGGGRYGSKDGPSHRVYIAFNSEQIKSASKNIGTFDLDHPNIYYSLRNEENSHRAILSRIDPNSRKLKSEQQHLVFYQERLKKLAIAEDRLKEVNAKINRIPESNKREIQKLQTEARNWKHNIDVLNREINRAERSDMFKRIVAEERKKFSDTALRDYKKEQRENIRSMQAENRAIREELTGTQSVMTIMEDEFVRLAKDLESKKIDLKTMQEMFLNQSKQYDKDTQKWLREYRNLMSQYRKLDARNDRNLSKIEQLEEIIQRQRQTAKAKVTSRRNTEMRHKIQRKANELNQLLLHGSKHRNVPEYLQPVVADILDAINMEVRDGDQRRASYEATLARYDRQIAMTNNPAEVSRLIEKRNEYAAKGDQFANKMAELQKAYERIQKDKIPNMEIDEGLSARLMELFVVVGDTPLGQMTSQQLDAVNDVLNITKATITNANKLFKEGQRKGIDEISKSTMREVRSVGGGAHKTTDTLDFVSKFGWNNLKPVYAFEAIGSNTLTGLFNNLRKGEDTLAVDLQEAKTFFQTQWRKHHGNDWDMEKKWKFTSTSGKPFELDLNQIMSLYALSKRDQAREHLRVGGFSFDSQYKRRDEIKVGPIKIKADVKTTDASAYNLTDETLGEIIGKLTADQRKFVDAMQTYLSDTMAAKGNEVSLQKYGIRLFKEQNYFPLHVADQYKAKVREQQTGDRKLKNAGFTQSVTPHAKNPVVLSSFTEVWAEHVDEMSLYHSFVLPLDDMSRVLNYHDIFTEETAAGSVVEAIRNAYGDGATQYIDQLIRDVNGGARTDSVASIINKWMGRAKKEQTMASLSVAIQQPSSILRACAMIDGKYFVGPKVTEKTHDRTWNEIKQYAPIAIIKEMGGFDVNVGKSTVDYLVDTAEYKGFGEKFKAMFTDEQFRDDVFGRLPALMDEMSWGVIWNAVKREQAELHPNVNGDAFMKLVANRFTDVIVHTQVYDSVFSRSGMMRSKDTGAKMMTSFMAEPTTTINMLFNTILQSKRGKINKAQVAKTAGAIVASLALNSALQSIVYAMRDDDEDKRYDEKWIENFYENFFNSLNPLGYIPFLRDVQNAFRGYDAERSDITLFAELMNAVQGLSSDELSAWDKVESVLGSAGNLRGIPLKNILRDGRGIAKTIAISLDRDDPATKTGRQMARKTGLQSAAKGLIPWVNVETYNDGEEMLLAIQNGDEEHIQRVFGRFENQQKAEGALQSAIREKYVAGDLSAEEAEDLLTTNFDRDDEHEVYWLLEKWDYAKENGSEDGYVKYGNLYELIDSGEDYASEITRLIEHGADASTIRSQISKKYHKEYLADETVREEIRDKLRPVYETTGMYESDIDEKFNDWDFEAEYGMTYSEFKTEYKAGNATEAEMRQAMKFYGKLNYEIEEGIRSLNKEKKFEDKYGMPLSDMKDAYDNGDITRNELINALVFNGATKSEARDEVAQRDVTNKYGIDYMKLDDAYKYGDISRQTFYQSMLDSGATRDEANEAILGYDWLKKNVNKYPDLQISDSKRFVIKVSDKMEERTLTDYGVSIDSYITYKEKAKDCKGVDADGDGYADPYTKAKQLFAMIDAMPISNEAKDGLALVSNAMSTIKKYAPWR